MELSSSVATGAVRVGLQVISNHRRPVLEFYADVRNRIGPEHEYETDDIRKKGERRKFKHRFQDIFVQITLINVGGVRAEDIDFQITGDFKREWPREGFGKILETVIPQIAPGQIMFLFRIDEHDLHNYPEGGGTPTSTKTERLEIVARYNGPKSLRNWFLSIHKKAMKRKQYESKFVFIPSMVIGDLPPAEYV